MKPHWTSSLPDEEYVMKKEYFPDGTEISPWFSEIPAASAEIPGKQYRLDQYGIFPNGTVQTQKLQDLIDLAAGEGGGCLVIPEGCYLSGALYFRQGVNLFIEKDGVLKGSDDIRDFPLCETRIEGQNCLYFPALINAEGLDGFTISGEGTIDGNGRRYWEDFWLRKEWNPRCTNKDSQRPRLVFLSHCTNVLVTGVTFQNSPFWTNHLYQCRYVKYIGCRMLSPVLPIKAPSTDAIDIDACQDVLVKNCYMAVNDDAVALKGGKGPWADEKPENGGNERIIIEDCEYGFCHGCLTLGSESIHNKNIILRNIKVGTGYNLLWMKLRPDTPQHYEHILVENIEGKAANFLNINPWSQFFDLQGRKDLPVSRCENVEIRNCRFTCDIFFNVRSDEEHYHLSGFTFRDLTVQAADTEMDMGKIENMIVDGLKLIRKETIDYPDAVTTLGEDNSVVTKEAAVLR